MESIGEILKTRRAERNLTLAAAHEATKITMQSLAALEEDRFDAFPNRVYARAFLRDYANFLGLDSGALLQRYEQEWGTPAPPVPARSMWPAVGGAAAAVVLIAAVAFGGYYYATYGRRARPAVERPAPPVRASQEPASQGPEKPAPPEKPTETTRPAIGSPAPEPGAPTSKPIPAGQVVVTLRAVAPVWVHVKRDGETEFQGTLKPGEQDQVSVAGKRIWVRAGAAGYLDVTVNGKYMGRFAGLRQYGVNKVFTAEAPTGP